MIESCFSRILLLCIFLLLFSNNGFGRNLMDNSVHKDHYIAADSYQGKSREMIELDYADAGPNFNGRSALPLPTVPPPPPTVPPTAAATPPSETGY